MMCSKYVRLISIITLIGSLGCTQSEYSRLAEKELSRGVRVDSVILGFNLGDSNDEFRKKCTALNQRQLLTQGPRGSVLYNLKDSSVHKSPSDIRLLIFPSFDDKGVISNMDLEFSYSAWAPWNRAYQADSLEVKLKRLLMSWYGGNDFVYADIGEKKVPVKVDGNRRILLKINDAQSVTVMVQDMMHSKFKKKK